MLVLSRKSQQSVVVGGADGANCLLKVTVLAIRGGRVKLGFEIDSGIPVYREEVWECVRDAQALIGPLATTPAGR